LFFCRVRDALLFCFAASFRIENKRCCLGTFSKNKALERNGKLDDPPSSLSKMKCYPGELMQANAVQVHSHRGIASTILVTPKLCCAQKRLV